MAGSLLALTLTGGTVLLLIQSSCGVLPPGYEDELYCPSDHCIRRRAGMPPGFTGPASAFWECASSDEPPYTQRVKPWGSNLGDEAKQKLLADGYHRKECGGAQEEESEHEPEVGIEGPEVVQPEIERGPETGGMPKPEPTSAPSQDNSMMFLIAGALVLGGVVWNFSQKSASPSKPTGDQKALMEAARKRQMEKLEQETEEIRSTDEWKAREKAAKDEVNGQSIKPENRRAAAEMGRCGGDTTRTIGVGKR